MSAAAAAAAAAALPPPRIATSDWQPLFVPQQLFTDRQGEVNAFLETNPAAFIDDDGRMTVLVRLVNYRKFHTRAFKMGGAFSESRYVVWRGSLQGHRFVPDGDAEAVAWDSADAPRAFSVWRGIEDARFLGAADRIMATAPELNVAGGGAPRLITATLVGSTARLETLLEPSVVEKNWLPFFVEGRAYGVYSVEPFVVKRLADATMATLGRCAALRDYHGSSNGVPWEGGHLFLIHRSFKEHRWLYFGPSYYAYSEPFVFLPHSYIEFPCSLSLLPSGGLLVGLGVNDAAAFLVVVNSPALPTMTSVAFTV